MLFGTMRNSIGQRTMQSSTSRKNIVSVKSTNALRRNSHMTEQHLNTGVKMPATSHRILLGGRLLYG